MATPRDLRDDQKDKLIEYGTRKNEILKELEQINAILKMALENYWTGHDDEILQWKNHQIYVTKYFKSKYLKIVKLNE